LLKPGYIAAACGITIAILCVSLIRRGEPRPEPSLPVIQKRIDDAIRDIVPFETIIQQPRIVKTDRIRPDPIPVPTPEPSELNEIDKQLDEQKPVVRTPRRRVEVKRDRGDVCRAHGMRKVMTGKYKWRCQR